MDLERQWQERDEYVHPWMKDDDFMTKFMYGNFTQIPNTPESRDSFLVSMRNLVLHSIENRGAKLLEAAKSWQATKFRDCFIGDFWFMLKQSIVEWKLPYSKILDAADTWDLNPDLSQVTYSAFHDIVLLLPEGTWKLNEEQKSFFLQVKDLGFTTTSETLFEDEAFKLALSRSLQDQIYSVNRDYTNFLATTSVKDILEWSTDWESWDEEGDEKWPPIDPPADPKSWGFSTHTSW